MSETIRVGVVGFGLGGRIFHAAVIAAVPGLDLAAIVQRHGTSAQETYPNAKIVRRVDELLEDQSIRLIAITTPNATHYELAKRCLEAGRDVVVDKPFALTTGQAEELVELAKSKGRLLSVYQNRRWDGDFLTIKQLLHQNTLGRLVSYEAHFDRWRPELRPQAWKESQEEGGGTLFDLGPHLVDQALALFGSPETVWADVRSERTNSTVDDAFDIKLSYPGLTAWLRSASLTCAPGPRFVLHGTHGSYIKYGLDPQEDALRTGGSFLNPHWGEEPEKAWGMLTLERDGALQYQAQPTLPGDYRHFYANVRDAIQGKASLAVPGEAGVLSIRVLELARLSSEKKQTLPFTLND